MRIYVADAFSNVCSSIFCDCGSFLLGTEGKSNMLLELTSLMVGFIPIAAILAQSPHLTKQTCIIGGSQKGTLWSFNIAVENQHYYS